MNNTIVIRNVSRLLLLLALQILVFRRINLGGDDFNYISILIYPIFILMLPANIPSSLMVFGGFLLGLVLDVFYDSIGIHAAACVFSCFARGVILEVLEPTGGYKDNSSPSKRQMGFWWFVRYSAIFMLIHTLVYFSVEAYTFVYWQQILLRTLPSFFFSMLFILIYSFIFDPAE